MLLRVNQLDILLATTLSMIPLGGFVDAGGIGLWGVLAPLGALVFSDVRSGVRWFVAWLEPLDDRSAESVGVSALSAST